jgi:1,4-dihydroxy-2-naphthoyl-CoA hydrolase
MPLNDPFSPFATLLEFDMVEDTPDRARATLTVLKKHTNRNGVMHGGAMMAFADQMGGTVTIANLRTGQNTTTIESKTNFFAAAPLGEVLSAETIPLHRGRTTVVVQTRITRADGKLAALVTQTQLVMTPPPKAG